MSLKDKLWEIPQGKWRVMAKNLYTDDLKKEKGMKFYTVIVCHDGHQIPLGRLRPTIFVICAEVLLLTPRTTSFLLQLLR